MSGLTNDNITTGGSPRSKFSLKKLPSRSHNITNSVTPRELSLSSTSSPIIHFGENKIIKHLPKEIVSNKNIKSEEDLVLSSDIDVSKISLDRETNIEKI